MSYKNIVAAFAIVIAFILPLSAASTVTLTGGCPLYLINSSRSYITFNITNTGNGTASDLQLNAVFPGIDAHNTTQIIPTVAPDTNYYKDFYLDKLIGEGSYAVNINATYVQSGSNYATVFPCIIYIGSLSGGPLLESVSVTGHIMNVTIRNTAAQSIEAQVTAVVPPSFSVKNATKAVTIAPDGKASVTFDVVTPNYNDASFPLIGELSYEANSTHYAQMASAALVFGSPVTTTGGGGIGLVTLVLIIIIVVILVLIAVSFYLRMNAHKGHEHHRQHHEKKAEEEGK
jgi:hypothetical protein